MKIKTNELEGAALDWAVAKAEGWDDETLGALARQYEKAWPCSNRTPTTDWSQGGTMMARLEMLTRGYGVWYAIPICDEVIELSGPTPLIAAMRAIVASELGDTVDVPEELS